MDLIEWQRKRREEWEAEQTQLAEDRHQKTLEWQEELAKKNRMSNFKVAVFAAVVGTVFGALLAVGVAHLQQLSQ